jgi:hypothetical protein
MFLEEDINHFQSVYYLKAQVVIVLVVEAGFSERSAGRSLDLSGDTL